MRLKNFMFGLVLALISKNLRACTRNWVSYKRIKEQYFSIHKNRQFQVDREAEYKCDSQKVWFRTRRKLLQSFNVNSKYTNSGFGECKNACNKQ